MDDWRPGKFPRDGESPRGMCGTSWTGYAVWTGIGAAGTAILGIALLGDSAAPLRVFFILLILGGVIGLKFA